MSIVRRKDSAGRTYYFNNNTGKRTTEEAWKRSHTDSKRSKTQFKSKTGYACSSAGRDLKVKQTSSAGRRLRKCAN